MPLFRWEIYREMSNHFWKGSIPQHANPFEDTPLPEDCLAVDIYSMDKGIAVRTTGDKLVNILWSNGRRKQAVAALGPDTLRSSTSYPEQHSAGNRLAAVTDALLSIKDHILPNDTNADVNTDGPPRPMKGAVSRKKKKDPKLNKQKMKEDNKERHAKTIAGRRAAKKTSRKAQPTAQGLHREEPESATHDPVDEIASILASTSALGTKGDTEVKAAVENMREERDFYILKSGNAKIPGQDIAPIIVSADKQEELIDHTLDVLSALSDVPLHLPLEGGPLARFTGAPGLRCALGTVGDVAAVRALCRRTGDWDRAYDVWE
ncbi:hypothetical protein F5X99DRAFT_412596 [Biscogniauxia marginata]|nr:hypothetical protein F5X99DRAFT_412596 [Biscogniauxia marginata]